MWQASTPDGAPRPRGPHPWLAALLAVACAGTAAAQDQIQLRDTKVVKRKVLGFDEDGVRLDNKTVLGWDEIESGKLRSNQESFDRLLKELGDHLYRIRRRLRAGEYRDLLPHAEAVYPRYAARRSPTAYMVCAALLWSRVAHGRREAALEPFLNCLDFLRPGDKGEAALPDLPGSRQLTFDPETGLTLDLPPVWFDVEAAKAALPGVKKTVAALAKPVPPGVFLYAATLALAAGDTEAADGYLAGLKSPNRTVRELALVVAAQREVVAGKAGKAVAELDTQADKVQPGNRPLVYYWLGLALLADADADKKKDGVLTLLHLPALYGDLAPDLAGAALYHAAQALSGLRDPSAAITLRRELLTRYAQTYHGLHLKAETDAKVEGDRKKDAGGDKK